MRADLHLHSTYSDGVFSPEEIARRVKEAGLSAFALTDHDSMEGVERARKAAKELGLFLVEGLEVSSYDEGRKVHVLGYGCKQNEAYSDFLESRKTAAVLRAEETRTLANSYFGLSISMEEILRYQTEKSAPLHTMHAVRAYSDKLRIKMRRLYEEYFSYQKPCYSALGRPTPEDAITVIHACGGKAVLAHPGKIHWGQEKRLALFARLVKRGLDGIECFHTAHTEEEAASFAAFAREHGLLITGGSDFHAEGTKRVIGLPPFEMSEELFAALSAKGA